MFIYSGYLIFLGWLPYYPIALFCAAFLIILGAKRIIVFLNSAKRICIQPIEIRGWILLSILALIHVLSFSSISSAGGEEVFLRNSGNTLLLPTFLWVTGLRMGKSHPFWVNSRLRKIMIPGLLGAIFLLTSTAIWLGLRNYNNPIFYFVNYRDQTQFNYLILGDFTAVTGLLAFAEESRWNIYKKMMVFFLISGLLFLQYSRTSFYLFIVVGTALLVLNRKKFIFQFLVVGIIFLITAASLNLSGLFSSDNPSIKRMAKLSQLSSDESWISRQYLLAEAGRSLSQRWIFGRYMDEWWETGVLGGYAHNILSYWISYGLLPFLFLVDFLVRLSLKSMRIFLKTHVFLPAAFMAFGTIALLISRAYNWPLLYLVLGFVSAYPYKS